MRLVQRIFVVVLAAAGVVSFAYSNRADARVGVVIGVPLGPWYYPPPYYYPPAYYPPPVVYAPGPPSYVEQAPPAPAPAPQASDSYYYCAASKSYYPYVRECPGGWERVPAQPR